MIVVTGGAGFIGSNLVRALNARGFKNILIVDDLSDGKKFINLVGGEITDYMDKQEFVQRLQDPNFFAANVKAVFHQGACSVTTEWNGKYMMENNYTYSKILLEFCLSKQIPFIYASSAAVYGGSTTFKESKECENPLNIYGYSKFLFDQYVRSLGKQNSQIVGLRYFNVYGPHEQHKGSMASVAYHLDQQIKKTGKVQLFAGSDGYADGEQRRDFIYVDDVVNINLWFFENSDKSGIFNVGTGKSQTFNEVASAILAWHAKGEIEYIPFPKSLEGRYQSFTQADLTQLRKVGYADNFLTVEQGINRYLDALNTPRCS